MLQTREVVPLPQGNAEFESQRQELLGAFAAKIPQDLILPPETLHKDLDVTHVPRSCGLLTAEELDITENYGLISLAEAIAAGKLSAVAVASAFCRRAIIAHQVTFCLSDIYMNEAIERAKLLDEHLTITGETVGPLHGIPISVKEMIPVANQLCSLGIIATRHIASEDCLLVEVLRDLGAVFYVKTHQPTAVLSLESTSALGRTLNPYNTNLSPGGSSGGEAALLAMRGSILGIGNDLGGSLRLPAMSCGLYTLKATSGFLTTAGMLRGPAIPRINLEIIMGFLSRSLRELEYVTSLVQAQKPFLRDPDTLPFPFTGSSSLTQMAPRKLKIGIMTSDGATQTQPPLSRAVEWARTRLDTAGFTTTPFEFYKPLEAYKTFWGIILPDGGESYCEALRAGNEPTFPALEDILKLARTADPRMAGGAEESATCIAGRRYQRDVYREAFLANWIAQGDPDIVISTGSFGAAAVHDTGFYANYTSIWNLVDYPAAIVPTPFRAEARNRYSPEEYQHLKVLGDDDRRARELWEQHDYSNAPVCLQISAKRHMENELFAALHQIKEALELS